MKTSLYTCRGRPAYVTVPLLRLVPSNLRYLLNLYFRHYRPLLKLVSWLSSAHLQKVGESGHINFLSQTFCRRNLGRHKFNLSGFVASEAYLLLYRLWPWELSHVSPKSQYSLSMKACNILWGRLWNTSDKLFYDILCIRRILRVPSSVPSYSHAPKKFIATYVLLITLQLLRGDS